MAALNHRLYALGGFDGTTLARVDEYDPQTDTWTRKHDMITARRAFASGVVDGKILVSGGMSFADSNNVTYIDSTEAYDPATDTWTELSACPMGMRTNNILGNHFVKGAVVAGSFHVLTYGVNLEDESNMNSRFQYDASTDSWTRTPGAPFGMASIQTATLGATVYVLSSSFMERGSAMWAWDSERDHWTIRQPMPIVDSGMIAAGGKLLAVGGSWHYERGGAVALIHQYDPANEQWTTPSQMAVPRRFPGVAVLDGFVYAVGGDAPAGDFRQMIPTGVVERFPVP